VQYDNHITHVEKVPPVDYKYPYGKAGYKIKNYYPPKFTITMDELNKAFELEDLFKINDCLL